MTAFIIIDQGRANVMDGTPSGCSFCGDTNGPHVLVDLIAQNPQGPIKLDRTVQVCAPKHEGETVLRQGCAGTLALQIGYHGPEVLAQAQASIKELTDVKARLEEKINELAESQVKVVPVEELVDLMRSGQPA